MAFRYKIVVTRKRGKKRGGRGFSREELKKIGISQKQALKLKLPIDLRRRSINEQNVNLLKQQIKEKKTMYEYLSEITRHVLLGSIKPKPGIKVEEVIENIIHKTLGV